jgi:hypothetical protein
MTAAKPLPSWLVRQLEASGHIVDGATRTARSRQCGKCGAVVVVGLTPEPCSHRAVLDPSPLSMLGELQALLAGRFTYDLGVHGGRLEIEDRDASHIEGSPAERPDAYRAHSDVLAAHKCSGEQFDSIPTRIGA